MKSSDLRLQLGVLALTAILAFAYGRYSVAPAKVQATTETQSDTTKNVDTDRVITIVQTPEGTKTTTTTEHITSVTDKKKDVKTATSTDNSRKTLNVSVLAANNVNEAFKPLYGVSVSKEIIGPVTAGLLFLSGGTIGVSIGINF